MPAPLTRTLVSRTRPLAEDLGRVEKAQVEKGFAGSWDTEPAVHKDGNTSHALDGRGNAGMLGEAGVRPPYSPADWHASRPAPELADILQHDLEQHLGQPIVDGEEAVGVRTSGLDDWLPETVLD